MMARCGCDGELTIARCPFGDGGLFLAIGTACALTDRKWTDCLIAPRSDPQISVVSIQPFSADLDASKMKKQDLSG